MSWSVEYDAQLGIIIEVFTGVVTVDEVRDEAMRCFALAEEKNTNCFLTDCAQAEFKLSNVDIVSISELYDRIGVKRPIRIAVISPESDTGQDVTDFFETVCVNRGWKAKAFSERQAALDCLLK